ncbi:MAG: hypothetical protein ACR2QB_02080, partial [Gammaproteobacteria bacterium]
LLWQLFRIPRPGLAFRYAVPVAIVLFSLAEVGAFFGVYPEYWKDLPAYPIANLVTVVIFGGAMAFFLRSPPPAASE